MTSHGSSPLKAASARVRVALAAAAGLLTSLLLLRFVGWLMAALGGWDVGAVVYVVWIWLAVFSLDAKATKTLATREDASRGAIDSVLLGASLVSLLAVGFVIASESKSSGLGEGVRVGMGVGSVVVSWLLVHTVFTLHYARLYYGDSPRRAKIEDAKDQDAKAIDFNMDEPPRYADFAYLAFTIGMTFQVSDTSLQTSEMRATALRHALLSYLFGTVIVATTINLVAGLAK